MIHKLVLNKKWISVASNVKANSSICGKNNPHHIENTPNKMLHFDVVKRISNFSFMDFFFVARNSLIEKSMVLASSSETYLFRI